MQLWWTWIQNYLGFWTDVYLHYICIWKQIKHCLLKWHGIITKYVCLLFVYLEGLMEEFAVDFRIINPKAITMGQLYGCLIQWVTSGQMVFWPPLSDNRPSAPQMTASGSYSMGPSTRSGLRTWTLFWTITRRYVYILILQWTCLKPLRFSAGVWCVLLLNSCVWWVVEIIQMSS